MKKQEDRKLGEKGKVGEWAVKDMRRYKRDEETSRSSKKNTFARADSVKTIPLA